MKIKVFYDGSSVEEFCNFKNVVGVTTGYSLDIPIRIIKKS